MIHQLLSVTREEKVSIFGLIVLPGYLYGPTSFALERLACRNHEVQPIFTTTRIFFACRRSCVENELARACFFDSTNRVFHYLWSNGAVAPSSRSSGASSKAHAHGHLSRPYTASAARNKSGTNPEHMPD